jgi:type VI secretion system protein ImpE
MDMDNRLGPLLEVVMNGTYYWISFKNIKRAVVPEPVHLVDLVWASVELTLANGTVMSGLIPARYPGTVNEEDSDLRMARKTVWNELTSNYYSGLGQRMFSTDATEVALLDLRELELD